MRAFFIYILLTSSLLLAALTMKQLPEHDKDFAIAGLLAGVNACLIWRIVRAHK